MYKPLAEHTSTTFSAAQQKLIHQRNQHYFIIFSKDFIQVCELFFLEYFSTIPFSLKIECVAHH